MPHAAFASPSRMSPVPENADQDDEDRDTDEDETSPGGGDESGRTGRETIPPEFLIAQRRPNDKNFLASFLRYNRPTQTQ